MPYLTPRVDVDTRGGVYGSIAGYPSTNKVYYRLSAPPSAADVARMASDVATSFPLEPQFTATMITVVTWFAVGYYSSRVTKLNTFQVAIANDAGE